MRHRRPSTATIIAMLALVVALGGTAIAAIRSGSSPPLTLCVSTKEGGAVKTPKGGACKTGYALTEVNREGPAGKEGSAGTSIVARVRSASSIETNTTNPYSPTYGVDPVVGNLWTQGPTELDQLTTAVSMTVPPEASCSARSPDGVTLPGEARAYILVDGIPVGSGRVVNKISIEEPVTRVVPLEWGQVLHHAGEGEVPYLPGLLVGSANPGWLLEPRNPTGHEITIQEADDCGANGGNSGSHFTINSVSIDVIGVK